MKRADYINWDEYFMGVAMLAARRSKDPNTQALYYYKVAGCLPEDMQAYVQEQGYGQILPMNTQALKALQKTNVTVLEDGNMILPMTQEAVTITQDFNYHLLQMQEDGIARKLGMESHAVSANTSLWLVPAYAFREVLSFIKLLPFLLG